MNQIMNGQPQMGSAQPMQSQGSSRAPWVVLVIVVVVVLAVLGFLFRDKLGMGQKSQTKLSGYQAVFLTNGQVYFGKVSDMRDKYVTLKDIYYLQVNQQEQLQSGQPAATTTTSNQQPQLSLVKLGNELHGPDDIMQINRDQILFFEELKADGRVAQAIEEYKKNGANANAGTQTPAAQTPATTPPATQTPAPVK
ncbi:MAG: hypothetical protein ACYC5G_02950 [Candidatus Doudnabacteria bacterium]